MLRYVTATIVAVAIGLSARTHDAGAATNAQVKQAIRQVFKARAAQADCIAYAESKYDENAVSATGDHGEFQINAKTWFDRVARWARGPRGYRRFYVQRKFIHDPVYNAKVAYVISEGGTNWGPWTTYTKLGLCH